MELGFVEEPENTWRLLRCYFPSKVGGKPAWLDPEHLPSVDDMECGCCHKPLVFLLQLYSPNDDKLDSFHRTIFVFCCTNGTCYSSENDAFPFKVFRSMLPKENDYYPADPPDYDEPNAIRECSQFTNLCGLCGNHGVKKCSRCREVQYCSKDHQVFHWKLLHKYQCSKPKDENNEVEMEKSILFSEKELVIEPEPTAPKKENTESEFENLKNHIQSGDYTEEELNDAVANVKSDKAFEKFQKQIAVEPEQVIRYQREGSVLWCSSENIPSKIPSCECGAQRQFEFQIMPQLLNHLKVDHSIEGPTIDWGTVAIYTCHDDCNISPYIKEYCWLQHFSKEAI
nr:programmed cell death protein 2 [Ciona intestinalis]|eukprot:XP_002126749.1 programmed cell death protein 2 [Ciona intestinalis]